MRGKKASAYQIRHETETTEFSDAGLRGLSLRFAVDQRHEGNVDECEAVDVLPGQLKAEKSYLINRGNILFDANAELELAKGLNERHAFNVTDGATKLEADVSWL